MRSSRGSMARTMARYSLAPVPCGLGSKTATPPMCMCVFGVSRWRNEASRALSLWAVLTVRATLPGFGRALLFGTRPSFTRSRRRPLAEGERRRADVVEHALCAPGVARRADAPAVQDEAQ